MMTLEDDFMWITSHAFSEMRLMVEGALNLFEDDSGLLCRLAREAHELEVLSVIGNFSICYIRLSRLLSLMVADLLNSFIRL